MKERRILIGVLGMGLCLLLVTVFLGGAGHHVVADVERSRSTGGLTSFPVLRHLLQSNGALGTVFTYQGQLELGDEAVVGDCDMTFRLYDDPDVGSQIGSAIARTVSVVEGMFTVDLDFGNVAFDGDARWLELAVRCDGDPDYTTFTRQALRAAPYALYARRAPWSGLIDVPEGFADGVDDVAVVVSGTNVLAGEGLTQLSNGETLTLSVSFSGKGGEYGSVGSAARSDHLHDSRYYTQGQLNTAAAGGQVHWDNLVAVPTDLADGDDDTAYSAGVGLDLTGTQFSVDTLTIQRRVDGGCSSGNAIRAVNQDGSVACEIDDDTTYTSGTGVQLLGTTFSVQPTFRLPQGCDDGQIAKWNGAAWACGADETGGVSDAWSLLGNAGTNPSLNLLGTTDPVSLTLAVSGIAALRLEPNATSPNLVGGYSDNRAAAGVAGATIGGGGASGASNQVGADYATVSGGYANAANGSYATVPGGASNTAQGNYSFAAGRRAKANNQGCFVWGDATAADLSCNIDNRWIVRASGGVFLYTSPNLSQGVYVPPNVGAWSSVSDRDVKENVASVNAREVLERVVEIPVSTWHYIGEAAGIRHMGPMAQDFYGAFGLGDSERHINTLDADGVALAAIQGLYQLSLDQAARIRVLEAENIVLQERLDDLDARMEALESRRDSVDVAVLTRGAERATLLWEYGLTMGQVLQVLTDGGLILGVAVVLVVLGMVPRLRKAPTRRTRRGGQE